MKRRTFFQAATDLAAAAFMPWKPQLPYIETLEDGWRVIRPRTGDTVYLTEPIVLRGAEKLLIDGNVHSTAPYIVLATGHDCYLEIRGTFFIEHGMFQAFDEKKEMNRINCLQA